jgi:predicted Rossmann fold nucleotide-binding protein DprA/Smf involved in DNA uptake
MKRKTMRDLAEVLRDEMYMKNKIIDVLKERPKTIPEIAAELDCPPSEVTMWVMAMRRYGSIADLPKERADDYYRYKYVEDKSC